MIKERRECGECVACCVFMEVDEQQVHTKAMEPCGYLKDKSPPWIPSVLSAPTQKNCILGAKKPLCCLDYQCAWLRGAGDREDRPDRCGVLVDNMVAGRLLPGALVAKPLWDRADAQPAGIEAVRRISRSSDRPVIVVGFQDHQVRYVIGKGAS